MGKARKGGDVQNLTESGLIYMCRKGGLQHHLKDAELRWRFPACSLVLEPYNICVVYLLKLLASSPLPLASLTHVRLALGPLATTIQNEVS